MEPQFGSGTPLLGGTNPLAEAMQRRGIDTSVLNQVGGGSPIAQPMPQAPQGGQGMPQANSQMGSTQLPQGSESELIIKALSERLKHFNKMEETQMGV